MHTAAGSGDSRRVTSLAGYGVDVNCQNIVGDTPLHWAVRNRRLGTSTRLLELGADVLRSNDEGVTVGKDVVVYMDLLQQECIKRKLVELAQQPNRHKPWQAKSGASSPDCQSPRSSSSSNTSFHPSDGHLAWEVSNINEHDLAEGKKWLKRVRADLRQVVASFKASIGSTS